MQKVYRKVRGRRLVSLVTIILSLGFMAFVGVPAFAAAGADYPSKPVLFFALSSPGSGFDVTTRSIVNALTKEKLVTVPMPVENSSASVVGMSVAVSRFKGDAYMVAVGTNAIPLNYATGASKYNHKDTKPLCGLLSTYYGIAVRADSPYKTMNDLIKDLKDKPGKIPICGGRSDDPIFFGATFMKAGMDPTKVNYTAFVGSEAVMSVLEGSCKATTMTLSEILPVVEGKKARFLAVSSAKRLESTALKDVPTLRELGIDVVFANDRYIFSDAAMPDYAVKYWRNTFAKMVKTPTWQETLKKFQWEDNFQVEGIDAVLDQTQSVITEMVKKLGRDKK